MDASLSVDDVIARLHGSRDGLDEAAVMHARREWGWNELPRKGISIGSILLRQFQDVLVYILLAALLLTVALRVMTGDGSLENSVDIIAILSILLLNALLGFVQEYRSEQALRSLQDLTSPHVRVRRSGRERLISSRELVPGDLVILEAGDRVSADGRLLHVSHLDVNESSLTGESVVIPKTSDAIPAAHSIGDQRNMVFAGTLVTRGNAEYIVTATGLQSEIGRIAMLVAASEPPPTPLQRRMKTLSATMGIAVLALCLLLAFVQYQRGVAVLDIVLLTVSLAVSAVPEGLPAVVTACLAMGVRRMAALHALVMRLDSLETLGSIDVICSDKTGTITQNAMIVRQTWTLSESADDRRLLVQIGASCNRAQLPDLGDPTEIGLLRYAGEQHVERLDLEEEEVPFTSEGKYMQTRHGDRSFLKGAPEVIRRICDGPESDVIHEHAVAMAKSGLRVLAMAVKDKKKIRCVGLMGMEDPPRQAVRPAMQESRQAGIRTVMITGDHADTALAVARQVGIDGDVVEGKTLAAMTDDELRATVRTVSVYARVSPEHKIAILRALQKNGHIVAMTGDGVNDAPALKAADVGIAMGKDGTQVAREAASLVLTDDNYATIVAAIREGRHIYDNIRKFILYLVRANVGQIFLFTTTVALSLPLPLLPIHILWINLMTDGLPALALGMENAESGIMRRPPRPSNEQMFTGVWTNLVLAALVSCGITFLIFLHSLTSGDSVTHARTMAFTFSILFEILLAYHSRSFQPVWRIGIFSNRWLNAAALLPFVLQAVLVLTPLRDVFSLAPLTADDVLLFAGAGLAGFLFLELTKSLRMAHRRT
ncbi:MAG TPA: cation-translocating P-type ATPase [Candidatus Peribacteraceae bacterium]|nr:cation-translocating P-type ATPase [Candidatus Peribacteraceae bacterium]